MKNKICALCKGETRSGYYIDIFYITGVTTPIPACDICRDLLREAKERIDVSKPIVDIEQKIRLAYLLGVARDHLQNSICFGAVRSSQ